MPTTAPFLLTLCLWILNCSLKCTCSSFYHRLFAREDSNHQVCITGLTQQHVHNVEELMEVFIYVGRRSEGEKSQWIVPLTNQPSITSSQNCVTESIFLQVVVISSLWNAQGNSYKDVSGWLCQALSPSANMMFLSNVKLVCQTCLS